MFFGSIRGGGAQRSQASHRIRIEGHVSAGFDAVRDAFAENFSRRHELGGACCVYHRGEKVVDLWGGVRNKSTGEPWEEGTMVLAHQAGLFAFDEPVDRSVVSDLDRLAEPPPRDSFSSTRYR